MKTNQDSKLCKKIGLTLLVLAAIGLSSCQKAKDGENAKAPALDVTSWQAQETASRTKGGVVIPTKTILKCRTTDSSDTVYYYTLIANPEGKITSSNSNYTETEFLDAEVSVEIFKKNMAGTQLTFAGMLNLPVKVYFVKKANSDQEYYLRASQETMNFSKAYYEKSYDLANLVNDDLLLNFSFQSQNHSPYVNTDFPSLRDPQNNYGAMLECVNP